MVDQRPGPGDPEPESGVPDPAGDGDRFPDIAPETAPEVSSTDWSGSPRSAGEGSPAAPTGTEPPAAVPLPDSTQPPVVPPPPDAPATAPLAWGSVAASQPPAGQPSGGPDPANPAPPVTWDVAAPVQREIAPGLVFASTPRRFVAYVIDNFLILILAWIVAIGLILVVGSSSTIASVLSAVTFMAVTFGYFALGWRSGARATPGMRVLRLQIGNAFDGRPLTMDQAVRRWVALGYPLYALSVIPAVAGLASLAELVLLIALLITTIASQTKQGLHDRFANSAVVEPTGQGSGAIVGCVLILIVVVVILPLLSIIALVFLGGQVSQILSSVASPAP